MGHKIPGLTYQVQQVLRSKLAIGQSKHQAKRTGEASEHIYSWNTYTTYLRHCIYFAKWCRAKYKCKTLDECRPHVAAWMQSRSDLSPYTLKMELSALAKLYGVSAADFDVTLPKRARADISRSRGEKARDAHFSEASHADIITFCRCTGLRRAELSALRGDRLQFIPGAGPCISLISGTKGGKRRTVPIIGAPEEIALVCQLMQQAGDGKVFDHVPSGMDVHGYRAQYATAYYQQLARPLEDIPRDDLYICRKDRRGTRLDKRAMLQVSRALGHNRISVIAGHYLQDV